MPSIAELQTIMPFFLAVSFVFGCLVGSFCNVCVGRWPYGESVISPRSRCPKCKNPIAWYDNIPLLSWLFLGAKCRHCKLPISWQYPFVEALTGVLFLLVFWRFGFDAATPVYMGLCAAMIVVTFQDFADWTIPNEITFPGIPLGLVLSVFAMFLEGKTQLRVLDPVDSLLGIALGGGSLYAMDRITVLLLKKPGMGFGDVKLLAMLGAFLGWKGVIAIIVLASFAGSIIGILMLLFFRMRGESTTTTLTTEETAEKDSPLDEDDDGVTLEGHYLPFGPYLALGGIVYMFVGPELWDWYISLMTPPPLN